MPLYPDVLIDIRENRARLELLSAVATLSCSYLIVHGDADITVPVAEARALAAQIPLLQEKRALGGKATAYVCEARVCDLPARDTETFGKQIRKKARPYPPGDSPGG